MKRREKLLIADDEQWVHGLLGQVLDNDGVDIMHAYDGKETLECAENEHPDVIVLDILMPCMDGRDVCKKLKSNPETEDMKVVILSGKDEQHDRILAFQLGADDYFTKPFSVHHVARKITRLLESRE